MLRGPLLLFCGSLLSCGSVPERAPLLFESEEGDSAVFYFSLEKRISSEFATEAFVAYLEGKSEDSRLAREALETYQDLMVDADQMIFAKSCTWDRPDPINVLSTHPHAMGMILLCRLYEARARIRMAEGDTDGAVLDMIRMQKMAVDLKSDRVMVMHLVGIVLLGYADRFFKTRIMPHGLSPSQVKLLHRHTLVLLRRCASPVETLQCLKEEELASLEWLVGTDLPEVVRRLSGIGPTPEASFTEEVWARLRPAWTSDLAKSEKLLREKLEKRWTKVMEQAGKPILELEVPDDEKRKAFSRRIARYLVLGGEEAEKDREFYAETLVFLTKANYARTIRNSHIQRTALELQQLWCRLEMEYERTGEFPATLEDLELRIIDPFDGKAVKYRRPDPSTYLVTCAGDEIKAEGIFLLMSELGVIGSASLYFHLADRDIDNLAYSVWRIRHD